jgi:branched-chain amino acid transport system substrate-binding protein
MPGMETGRADALAARRLGRRRVFAPAAGLVMCLALLASGCAPRGLEPAPTPDAATGAVQPVSISPPRYRRSGDQGSAEASGRIVRVGAALSLTGTAKLFGSAQRSGIKLAQDEINASHMLGSTRLEVVVEDDASDREQASAVFQKFIENSHVVAILGPTLSDTALSVDPIAQQASVPVLAISNAAGGITQIGNFIFRDCLSESQLTPQIIKMVRARLKVHRAALFYTDTDANRAGSHGFKKALQDFGIHIAAELSFTREQTDFSPQLEEIAATRPDALFVTAPAQLAAPILIQAHQHGLGNTPIIGSNAFNSDTVLRSAGDAAEGLIVGSAWSAANPSPRNQQFIQSYRARYGVDPDQLAAQAYTGVYILASAIQDARTATDPRAVRDALERVHKLDTPLGLFSFNAQHDADYPPTVQIVRKGRLQLF